MASLEDMSLDVEAWTLFSQCLTKYIAVDAATNSGVLIRGKDGKSRSSTEKLLSTEARALISRHIHRQDTEEAGAAKVLHPRASMKISRQCMNKKAKCTPAP